MLAAGTTGNTTFIEKVLWAPPAGWRDGTECPLRPPGLLTRPYFDGPPAATAIFLPRERRTSRPESGKVYLNSTPDPEISYFARRHAYAYISPQTAPCRAEPIPFIRRVFRTLALDLPQTFKLQTPTCHGDVTVRFRTPEDREAAMGRQPFELDGATVMLVREGQTPNVRRATHDYVVHVALHRYPIEQRTEKMIRANCSSFGFMHEIDPACFAAPDLSTVRVVLQLDHPREIPRELRIEYYDGLSLTSVIPVEVVRVWNRSHSYDANRQYVRIFGAPAAAA
ncbi:unnamed protein product [Alopecurus aequalis]